MLLPPIDKRREKNMDTNELPFPVTSDLVRMDHIRSENIEWLFLEFCGKS